MLLKTMQANDIGCIEPIIGIKNWKKFAQLSFGTSEDTEKWEINRCFNILRKAPNRCFIYKIFFFLFLIQISLFLFLIKFLILFFCLINFYLMTYFIYSYLYCFAKIFITDKMDFEMVFWSELACSLKFS